MNIDLLLTNFTNPTLLFFILGIIAVMVKSDLDIPESSFKFISLYLLFSIGFKGGQELAHHDFNAGVLYAILFGIAIAAVIPIYSFFILKRKLSVANAGAIAASYGSVSAVTFVAASSFLETVKLTFSGHMVAVMAIMEVPAIIVGVLLMMRFETKTKESSSLSGIIKHSLTNGSVLMLVGSLLIGFLSDGKQAVDIQHFTTDIFKGFLAIFLLKMGMTTASRFNAFLSHGRFSFLFALLMPLFNGILVAIISGFVTPDLGDRFIFSVLASSASYIAVPAAMKLAAPQADPGLYVPMALGVTFPMNIIIGMPIYFFVIQTFS